MSVALGTVRSRRAPSRGVITALLLLGGSASAQEESSTPAPVREAAVCSRCHASSSRATAMRDAAGRSIAPFDLWRGTMMANASRDPLWRAVLSAETAAVPEGRELIESTCLACHAPLARARGFDDHGAGTLMHLLECPTEPGDQARDGVSCTTCHGMGGEGLGGEESFSAGYVLNEDELLFGPHRSPFAMPMRRFTGLTPAHGVHLLDAAHCGSCHTLETEALDAGGSATGRVFLEQAPYLEWRNSAFSDEIGRRGPRATCQDCHAPTVDVDGRSIRTRIARNPGGRDFPPTRPREPFGRHVFVGGNTLVPTLLRDHPEELGVAAPGDALQSVVDAAREQLTARSARLAIQDLQWAPDALTFRVQVENLTGHKLPTAHPTRRAWLCVVVRDESGAVLFASGRADASGRILGADGRPLESERAGGPIEPHRQIVRTGDEVATYQGIMGDTEGAPTHTLLRGARWLVDDRLLPLGWSSDHADAPRTAPVGTRDDPDFVGGSDEVTYAPVLEGRGPVTVEATLLYQSLSARWADELFQVETPEVETFRRLYEGADRTPVVLASDRRRLERLERP